MPKAAHKVVVIGHRNPDTDSICSAIAYAEAGSLLHEAACRGFIVAQLPAGVKKNKHAAKPLFIGQNA